MVNVMRSFILKSTKQSLALLKKQLLNTPIRALNQAHEAALSIQAIETKYFKSNKISMDSTFYNEHTLAYFQTELKKYLTIINIRLTEFKITQPLFGSINRSFIAPSLADLSLDSTELTVGNQSSVPDKLKLVDEILTRYQTKKMIYQ
jgi:hypothetical protein